MFCVSSSWCRNGLVCNGVYSVLSCFNLLTEEKKAGFFDCVPAVVWLLVFCVSFSWYHGGLFCDYGISWSYSLFWSEWESDLRSSTPQSRTLTTRQRRFSYLVVFCVSSSRYHGGLVCDNGIS